jgi:hypothetical protein
LFCDGQQFYFERWGRAASRTPRTLPIARTRFAHVKNARATLLELVEEMFDEKRRETGERRTF